ncbi:MULTISPECIES: 30S ribosomal protein S20 [Paraclostridium]|jgi:small subunit ribosomal protein S20|uniref:Small ribosomal subunit protein bS20 n=3 Tax=Paraclostridium TaxID=1849822 RepID=A0A0M3DMQ4_9FIRM|nr:MULTISPECIES: 30S ribosomal protein S20 [Paraclostridium]KGJ50871.1 30S ribosomal protein S20 [Clostridium sp. NCR]MCU9809341.1 30S ribosomal protein S20 [Paraclostridium sp. AKS46]MDV8110246.1 30S ribosomal protein S20 [Bacillus sp. BAU-SS-2023]EQK41887.1 ribosomal protein S20 [[Clostridium] bifermentans ATCC 638] [Paraclostridium bifermentans ATCC 638 = DSM 14991]KKY02692.1 30S ribosomal protein S20 [Paraclostridium benzoelyticum]
MANIKSAKKRIKVIEKKTALNRARKSQIKTAIRKFEEAVTAGNREEAAARFQYAQKRISQVASKGTIHKNAAARKVAKLAQKLNGMNA